MYGFGISHMWNSDFQLKIISAMQYVLNVQSDNLDICSRKNLVPLRVIQEGGYSNEETSPFTIFWPQSQHPFCGCNNHWEQKMNMWLHRCIKNSLRSICDLFLALLTSAIFSFISKRVSRWNTTQCYFALGILFQ